MNITIDRLTIRSATKKDAKILTDWWNDGAVMAHAGFPNGLHQPIEKTIMQIQANETTLSQLCIIEYDGNLIGEMNFSLTDENAIIGIKICEKSYQNRGLGSRCIQMLIDYLFTDKTLHSIINIQKIRLDTNVKNTRAQRVYEKLGFKKIRVNVDAWTNQLGEKQSSIDYEMIYDDYIKLLMRPIWIKPIENYFPTSEQEAKDKALILTFIERNPDVFERTNLAAHFTSSAIVINETMTKILFAYHNIYQSWAWVGGHNDGNRDFLAVALKEAKEETGIKNIRPHNCEIFMLDVVKVDNHIKHEAYVPDHLHLNVTYLLIANECDHLTVKPDENSGVKWFYLDEVLEHVSEKRMIPIYQKAINRIQNIKEPV